MKVIPISEGTFTIDKTKLFVPFDDDVHELNERPRGSLLVEVQPFLVITDKDVLLLDTGLGFEKDGELQIYTNLRHAGIEPGDVTKVLMTHLHKDHAGGVTYGERHENISFPNATYYIQKLELDFAMTTGMPSFIPDELQALQSAANVHLLNEVNGTIDGYIDYELTGGHSPYHQSFWIREGNEVVFFGGDNAPQLQQMKIRYKTKYDHDPEKAMQLREKWWEQGNNEHWTFLFYHDVKSPTYKKQ
ncbi:MAG TPA: MBL fold metallo-hydrolase [Chitinophagaceae bacterium]